MTELEEKLEASLAMVRREPVRDSLEFTAEQRTMIRDTFANGASEKEFQVLLEIAKLRKLNPLLKQIHFVKRWNKQLGRDVWSAQVSIDGLRAIAERTGKYDGQDEAEFERDDKGYILSCRVRVYRKDWSRAAVGVAHWDEYVQRGKDNQPTRFWQEMPHVMLAKCAEAIAMRKAFPEDMSGLYVDEEMQQADNLHISPHLLPGESADQPPRESPEFDSLMETLKKADKELFDPSAEYVTVLRWRNALGNKAKGIRTDIGALISKLYTGDALSPKQREEMSKLANRLDRKMTTLETKLAPAVEASFVDPPDETEAFAPERKPGEDDD